MSTQTETKMGAKELRGHADEELRSLERSLREELFKFRLQRYTNQLENTMQIRKLRRDLARVKTILTARSQGLEVQGQGAPTTAEAGAGASPASGNASAR